MSAIRTQVYLTPEHRKRIDALARATGLSLAEIVRQALDRYLERERADVAQSLATTFGADPGVKAPSRGEWKRG